MTVLDSLVGCSFQDMSRYSDLSLLPRDLSQQIFNELVESSCLTEASLGAFRDCALQVTHLYLLVTKLWVKNKDVNVLLFPRKRRQCELGCTIDVAILSL